MRVRLKHLTCCVRAGGLKRRRFLSQVAVLAGGFAVQLLSISTTQAQGARTDLLLFIRDLTDHLEKMTDWVMWLDDAGNALRDQEIVPHAPAPGADKFTAMQEAALKMAKDIPVPDLPVIRPLPELAQNVSRDARRLELSQGMSGLEVAADSAKELREAVEMLSRMRQQIWTQRKQLEHAEQVIGKVAFKIPAQEINYILEFTYLNIVGEFIPNNQKILETIEDKLGRLRTQRTKLADLTKVYGTRLLLLLTTEQAALSAERDKFQLEQAELGKRKEAIDASESELRAKAAEARQRSDQAQQIREEMVYKLEDRDNHIRRRDQLQRSIESLSSQINRPYKCSEGNDWDHCDNHPNQKKQYTENIWAMKQSRAQAELAVANMNEAILTFSSELRELASQRDAMTAGAQALAAELSRDQAKLTASRSKLTDDVSDFFARSYRSRAVAFHAESQEQSKVVEQWLKSI